jgi:hypothetical protein
MNIGTGTPLFDDDMQGIGRAAVKGAIIAGLFIAVFMLAVGMATGASFGASLGMAAFAAFFGGPGFGGMLGAVIHAGHDHSVVSTPLHVDMANQSRDQALEASRLTTPSEQELVAVGHAGNDRHETDTPGD